MKNIVIIIGIILLPKIVQGQDFSVLNNFTVNEARLLVFDEDKQAQHDSLVNILMSKQFVKNVDSLKIDGVISYNESGTRYYIIKTKSPSNVICFQQNASNLSITPVILENDLYWAVKKIKFEYLVKLIYFQNTDNKLLNTLKNASKATYNGLNISKLKIAVSNTNIYSEFLNN